ncbi:MAG: hypothetical protein A2Z72_03890 [Omnitrophica bacterium RBG_13_46_9]|nr:MAG: hypothetical protein A2Z72_03890 [Omnitrophica bacterium RBG_13_46_9]
MGKKRILLMYISKNSGHHHASLAIESALRELSDDVEVLNVNSFLYTNPILEKIINKTYMSVIKRTPEVWGYLYDNPKVVRRTQKLRESIHKYNSSKMRNLLESYKPDAVACTQAFPCGIVSDYKKTSCSDLVLAGVLTDYAPHAYWFFDNVDIYFVPSEETRQRFVSYGISQDRVKLTGIPIDPRFKKIIDRKKVLDSMNFSPAMPIILLMGGSQGLGPIKEIVKVLDNSPTAFQIIVVAGINKRLYNGLSKLAPRLKKKTAVVGYTENVDELMSISSLIITKPGGITVSEALVKGLPILIVKPIPGHEQMNTDHLVKHNLAIKANNLSDLEIFVSELLSNPKALENMRERIKSFSKPQSAFDIAETILEKINL